MWEFWREEPMFEGILSAAWSSLGFLAVVMRNDPWKVQLFTFADGRFSQQNVLKTTIKLFSSLILRPGHVTFSDLFPCLLHVADNSVRGSAHVMNVVNEDGPVGCVVQSLPYRVNCIACKGYLCAVVSGSDVLVLQMDGASSASSANYTLQRTIVADAMAVKFDRISAKLLVCTNAGDYLAAVGTEDWTMQRMEEVNGGLCESGFVIIEQCGDADAYLVSGICGFGSRTKSTLYLMSNGGSIRSILHDADRGDVYGWALVFVPGCGVLRLALAGGQQEKFLVQVFATRDMISMAGMSVARLRWMVAVARGCIA
jgi:hypothetical protein